MDKQDDRKIQTQNEKIKPLKPQAGATEKKMKEIGGVNGPEPTRYGDWEKKGRCIDFWCELPYLKTS